MPRRPLIGDGPRRTAATDLETPRATIEPEPFSIEEAIEATGPNRAIEPMTAIGAIEPVHDVEAMSATPPPSAAPASSPAVPAANAAAPMRMAGPPMAAPGPVHHATPHPMRPAPDGEDGQLERTATAPQLRRFIKSRAYVPMHELRRRFGINGGDDEVTPVDLERTRVFVGLPEREGRLLAELLRGGDIGYELSMDPISPIVVGVYPMRPVTRG